MTTTTQPPATNPLLQYATLFATEWGFSVFPLHGIDPAGDCTCGFSDCKSPGKHPLSELAPNGVKNATKDVEQIRLWWTLKPFANIGVACGKDSGLAVVDVDEAKGGEVESLGDFPDTVAVKTGGGMHFYFRCPESEIRNSASVLAPFVDVRGEGGYVVAPPSRHANGSEYAFLTDSGSLSPFPAEWVERLAAPSARQHSTPNGNGNGNGHGSHTPGHTLVVPPPSGLTIPEAIAAGSRNETLIKLAGGVRRYGVSENAIFSMLAVENQRLCKPPLADSELHQIARSASRYAPHDALEAAADDADSIAPDYENTLRPYLLSEFFGVEFEEKEILGFHIGKRDICMISAATNAGKTTLLRNISLCMAAGRSFMPIYDGRRPVKIAYFDFENDAQDTQRDLRQMAAVFNEYERANLEKHFIIIPKGLMNGELFQFNSHEKWASELVRENGVEFIIVDNVSAAYDLNDENSNAEVTKKIIKPLLKMAYKNNCAFVFAHHFGKNKDSEGVYAGRGASALQSLSKSVFNMFGDVSKGDPVTLECSKRKADGGQGYSETFKLDPDRWFHHTAATVPVQKRGAYQAIREFVQARTYPMTVATKEIVERFEGDYTVSVIKQALKDLVEHGFIDKPKHGFYCAAIDENGEEKGTPEW